MPKPCIDRHCTRSVFIVHSCTGAAVFSFADGGARIRRAWYGSSITGAFLV